MKSSRVTRIPSSSPYLENLDYLADNPFRELFHFFFVFLFQTFLGFNCLLVGI